MGHTIKIPVTLLGAINNCEVMMYVSAVQFKLLQQEHFYMELTPHHPYSMTEN